MKLNPFLSLSSPIAQLVEQQPLELRVTGSTPVRGSIYFFEIKKRRCASLCSSRTSDLSPFPLACEAAFTVGPGAPSSLGRAMTMCSSTFGVFIR